MSENGSLSRGALANVEDVPIGTILPFAPGDVHEDFLPLDGGYIDTTDHADLCRVLSRAWKDVGRYFEAHGGHITIAGYRLPDCTDQAVAQKLLHGAVLDNFPEIVLAIRWRRTVSDDGSRS